ncbi:MAG TPA: MBL fold metallo-hydrolase [Acidimicrobiales bacterium]|nr:MBL fold metallo-hydrolase [Acidimicrobiales bacterium]
MDVTILGSGSPIPDADRAGPSGLIEASGQKFLVDCGRGVLMRLTAAGVVVPQLDAVLLTHLHSDHTTDFNDVVTTWWVMPMSAGRALRVIGPPGTQAFVDATIAAMRADISYRIDHHADINEPPAIEVTEVTDGVAFERGEVRIIAGLVDHGVVRPAVGYRVEAEGGVVCWPGDTLPCDGVDALAHDADVYVQTVVRRSLVEMVPVQRFLDILDYHSDLAGAGGTAKRAGVKTLVLNHPVPAPATGTEHEWIGEAASEFDGRIVFAHDLMKLSAP